MEPLKLAQSSFVTTPIHIASLPHHSSCPEPVALAIKGRCDQGAGHPLEPRRFVPEGRAKRPGSFHATGLFQAESERYSNNPARLCISV
ncbi:hypothetical protein PAPYR_13118 [Paratrimastix pyriformis]|uniref:Uncharacterized protein n=1 Tax=Paratrimastix pyriformis TaxID=342808 RepID=A0ABQ8U4C0_9EUKA|nr:hypothetical protein PAPYR_13118 [Paratrimastix pyriformis]